jgi:hypothetical protein
MKAAFKVTDVDNINMTLICTMRMDEWRLVRDHLSAVVGTLSFRNALTAMIRKADENFHSEGKESDGL